MLPWSSVTTLLDICHAGPWSHVICFLPCCRGFSRVHSGHRHSGAFCFNFEGPDSRIAVHVADRVRRSLFVVGHTAVLRIAETAAFMSPVGGILACSSWSPANRRSGTSGHPQALLVSGEAIGNISTSHTISSRPGKAGSPHREYCASSSSFFNG